MESILICVFLCVESSMMFLFGVSFDLVFYESLLGVAIAADEGMVGQ